MVRGWADSWAVRLGAVGVLLAVILGWAAGTAAGGVAGVLGALAGLVPPAVVGVAIDAWSQRMARQQRRQELLAIFAVPEPSDDGEGQQ